MKIVVTFDSWEELESFRNPVKSVPVGEIEVPVSPLLQPVVKAAEAVKEKLTETLNADTVAAVASEPKPEPEPDYELLRVEVRSVLAELNKTHAGKPAQKLIADMGFKGLSDVPGNRLQDLMDRAKEALNA